MRISVLGLLFAAATVVAPSPCSAQIGRPAAQLTPRVETEAVRAGETAWLALRVVLPEGLHVQSNAPRDPALIPTVLTIDAPAGVTVEEVTYPPAVDFRQEGLELPLAVFGHDFTLRIRLSIGRGVLPGESQVSGRLRYQACNDRVCFPPATAETRWTLRLVPGGAEITGTQPGASGRIAAVAGGAEAAEPAPTPLTIVAMTRAAMGRDFPQAEQLVRSFRATHGVTPEMLLANSWLGRGALAARNLDLAEAYAQETYELGLAELRRRPMDQDGVFPTAFGAAIEVLGRVAAERGRRSEAIAFLSQELVTHGATSIHKRIQKNINLLSLEGTVAPALELSEFQGVTPPTLAELKGRVVLLFFWAHWCSDCKAQGPLLEKLVRQHGPRGFTVVAPTQRYGYAAGGNPAPAAEEARHIEQVRQSSYAWMDSIPVTLNEANHRRYGVSTTPTIVLIDREGVVRLYHPGLMTEAQLEPLVRGLVEADGPG